jgi:hypothetical protein
MLFHVIGQLQLLDHATLFIFFFKKTTTTKTKRAIKFNTNKSGCFESLKQGNQAAR